MGAESTTGGKQFPSLHTTYIRFKHNASHIETIRIGLMILNYKYDVFFNILGKLRFPNLSFFVKNTSLGFLTLISRTILKSLGFTI